MSEIQSIAQNNYILATQQEVSHDSSLSGNGTVDSPLGVVPGYNETVLWSGSTHTSGTDLTLSEPYSAFNTLKIYANGYTNTYQPQCNEFKLTTANEQIFYVLCENRPGSTPGIRFNYFELSGHPDRSKIRINYCWQYSMTGTAITNTSGTNANINFIVGVNRIANN